jgi:hypothetical protein
VVPFANMFSIHGRALGPYGGRLGHENFDVSQQSSKRQGRAADGTVDNIVLQFAARRAHTQRHWALPVQERQARSGQVAGRSLARADTATTVLGRDMRELFGAYVWRAAHRCVCMSVCTAVTDLGET